MVILHKVNKRSLVSQPENTLYLVRSGRRVFLSQRYVSDSSHLCGTEGETYFDDVANREVVFLDEVSEIYVLEINTY